MGGRQYSQILLERERAKKLQIIQQITAMKGTIDGYREELAALLATSTAGIRATFGKQVEAANRWIRTGEAIREPDIGIDRSLAELEQIHEECSTLAALGDRLVKEIGLSFTEIGDRMAFELAHRLVRVRTLIAAHRKGCARWFAEQVGRWPSLLQAASSHLDEENFAEATETLASIEAEVTELAQRSDELAAQQQARLYLLKAVRQVCCDLGMRETATPRYERSDDASSRILFSVASPDRGEIAFALSFDSMSTEAQPGRCLKDLDKLSSFLSAQYGIGTSFQEGTEGTDPQSKHAKARALPEDGDAAAAARGQ